MKTYTCLLVHLSTITLVCSLASCASQWDDLVPEEPEHEIAFSSSVVSGRRESRASAAYVDLKATKLPATITRDGKTEDLRVGVFGYFTGAETWAEVVGTAEYNTEAAFASASNGTLKGPWNHDTNVKLDEKGPTADFFFNTPLKVGDEVTGGGNNLHYLDETARRFWPNNNSGTDRLSFWAYYPYNATSTAGTYGIDFLTTSGQNLIPEGGGRGKVHFRMAETAAEQVDFLVSDLVTDANREAYPLLSDGGTGYVPKRVPLKFRHLLAQVRLYAYVDRPNRIVYQLDGEGNPKKVAADGDANIDPKTGEATTDTKAGDLLIDASQSAFWSDEVEMTVAVNNVKREATYTLTEHFDTSIGGDVYPYVNEKGLGSVRIEDYEQREEWFKDRKLNEEKMYGEYFPASNVLLFVPQQLLDANVPTFSVELVDKKNTDPRTGEKCRARITVNMLNMNIKWEQGFIYIYALLDSLRPGDDIVRGPESIEVLFDPTKLTDQW